MKRTRVPVDHNGSNTRPGVLAGIAILALCSLSATAEQRPPEYRVIDLGESGSSFFGGIYALNNDGEGTGANEQGHAVLFRKGETKDLGTLEDFGSSLGYGINREGEIAGLSDMQSEPHHAPHAFLYRHGQMRDLGTFGGTQSFASAINSQGEIVGGAAYPGDAVQHAFVYRNGRMTDIGSLGGNYSYGYGINSWGAVVGSSSLDSNPSPHHAFLYSEGKMKDLGTLSAGNSEALAINCAGQVIGDSATVNQDGAAHAFIYDKGRMQDIGTLYGDNYSIGYSINSEGEAVGASGYTVGQTNHAFLYVDGKMLDLLTLIDPSDPLLPASLVAARAINDHGVIGVNGYAHSTDALVHAYLLVPRGNHYRDDERSAWHKAHARECWREWIEEQSPSWR